jgi:hypothetical protein
MRTFEVKLIDKTYKIKPSVRSMLEYEKMTGKSSFHFEGLEAMITFLFCSLKANNRKGENLFTLDYEDFIDILDEHPEALTTFTNMVTDDMTTTKEGDQDSKNV